MKRDHKNMTCARQEFNKILLQKQKNNEIRLKQKMYPKLMLNKLKVMGNIFFIYDHLAPSSKKYFKKISIYMWPMFTRLHLFALMCRPCSPVCTRLHLCVAHVHP
jgi:hypothetical protein